MPCRDYEYETQPSVSQSDYDSLLAVKESMKKKLDQVTRVACEIEKQLTNKQVDSLSKEAQTWITRHRAEDARERKREEDQRRREQAVQERRERIEKARTAALKKLTREERDVLGLPHPA